MFPEAKSVICEKLIEWLDRKWQVEEMIRKKLTIVKRKSAKENQWFWKEWVKVTDGQDLLEIKHQIARLQRLLTVANGKKIKGEITQEQIQQARSIPLESIVNQPFKKFGKALIGLCPLHKEKTPSFRIYLENNTCWCFGCQQGGDVINLVRLLHGYSFREAVAYLTHNQ